MDEIQLDEIGTWRARYREMKPKTCAENRVRRIRFLNEEFGNAEGLQEGGCIYDGWKYVGCSRYEDGTLCVCGMLIKISHSLKFKTQKVGIGSCCVKRFGEEDYKGTRHEAKMKDLAKQLDTICRGCSGNKKKSHAYCGGPICPVLHKCKKCGDYKIEVDPYCGGEICVIAQQRAEIRERERELREAAEREWQRTHCGDCKEPKSPDDQYCGGDRCEWNDYHCSFCREGKDPGDLYCEGLFCSRCKHGQRENRKGIGKTGKPYDGWFCPCKMSNRQKCEPIWINWGKPKDQQWRTSTGGKPWLGSLDDIGWRMD